GGSATATAAGHGPPSIPPDRRAITGTLSRSRRQILPGRGGIIRCGCISADAVHSAGAMHRAVGEKAGWQWRRDPGRCGRPSQAPPPYALPHCHRLGSQTPCARDILPCMQIMRELEWIEAAPSMEDGEALTRSLNRFRRAMLREGLVGAIREGEDLDLTMVQLGGLLLLDADGGRSIGESAAELGRSVSAASRLLDQLVRRGLVTRREDERDRRAKRLAITEAGHALMARIERRRADTQLAVMARLTPAEQDLVLRAMEL